MKDISQNHVSFQNLSYSMVILPSYPYLKLDGFASDGVSWGDVEHASVRLGADGLSATNVKPVLYVGTFSLQPNSNARNILDLVIATSTPVYGKKTVAVAVGMTEKNETTGMTYVYSGGTITTAQGGNNANLDDGQSNKTYVVTFTEKVPLPL